MFRSKRFHKLLLGLGTAGALIALALLAYLLFARSRPVTLPAPTGPYAVGRVLLDWTDSARAETLSPSPAGPRELSVWIWYPADAPAAASPAPYLPKAWAKARDRLRGVGSILFQSASSIHGHALDGVPLAGAEAAYPVLIFEPGLGPAVPDYTALLEDLASHGYIILAVNPTYSSAVVVLGDGRRVEQSARGGIPDNASLAESKRLANALVEVWADDLIFALDQTEALNTDPQGLFYGRLDLARIGIFGHSFGGAAAAEACHRDARCQAGADLDGYPYGTVIQEGLAQPFLFLWSEVSDPHEAHFRQAVEDTRAIYDRLSVGYQGTIRGARHFNFTDYAVEFAPVLKLAGLLGSIDGARGLAISRAYVCAFFDSTLRNQPSPLLAGPAGDFPEVTFEARSR